jgi:hybrid cluster-associated redox disulfide protein
MTIAALLREWPETIPVFLGHRMACVGCSMSSFETVRGAAEIYRLQFEGFYSELETVIREYRENE